MDLDPLAAAAGVRLVAHEAIDSTNAEALTLGRAGERGPLWITAQCQSAGRGRRGRSWSSEPGNLYASLLLTDPSPPERAAELSFVAALALHDALGEVAGVLGPHLKLKWPNDVLCGGAKLAGILVEGEGGPGGFLAAVVGIGVNCAHHPEGTAYPATDLATAGVLATPERLFRTLSATMERRIREWDRGNGFAATRRAWLARAAGLGELIRVALHEREISGRFETLDEAGRLVLDTGDGMRETVTAGEIFPIGPVASAQPFVPGTVDR